MSQTVSFTDWLFEARIEKEYPTLMVPMLADLNLFYFEMQERNFDYLLENMQLDFIPNEIGRPGSNYYQDRILLTEKAPVLKIADYLKLIERLDQLQQRADSYGIKLTHVAGEPDEEDRIEELRIGFVFEEYEYHNAWDVPLKNRKNPTLMQHLDLLDNWLIGVIDELNKR